MGSKDPVKIATLGAFGSDDVGDFVGNVSGSNRAARAAENAAAAQADMARRTREEILSQGQTNQQRAMALAEATPQELASLGRAYSAADKALSREEKLVSTIDPALMEASKQVLGLLRGETADINKPMNEMRASQRQQLVNSLRAQYGPGAESSSIGQKALQQFDMQTNSLFAENQRNALAQTFGIAGSDFGGRLSRGISGLQTAGLGYSALQDRKLNTQLSTGNSMLGALSGTSQQMINSAGSQYVGEMLRSQAQMQTFNQAVGLASIYAGNYAGASGMAAGAQSQGVSPWQVNGAGGGGYNSGFWNGPAPAPTYRGY